MIADPRRPAFHVTPPVGWLNDPYGVIWHGGRYRLFFQYHPEAPEWTAAMSWGVVDSVDLVRWGAPRVAPRPATAAIVLAHPDGAQWSGEAEPVLPGPPAGLAVTHFRDPNVTRTVGGWRMLVGAGLDPPAGAVLGYSSPDLRKWFYEGVVCTRPDDAEGAWTGSVWECPQLFELDGAWVLVVSAAAGGRTQHVAYAVGGFDGSRFVPGPWRRLLHADAAYATTTFLDDAGRRCALSWLRESGPTPGRWSGALSLPMVLSRSGDRVLVSAHPDIATLRAFPTDRLGPQCEVVVRAVLPTGGRLEIDLGTLGLRADRDPARLWLTRPGQTRQQLPLDGVQGHVEVRVVLDASVAEVFTPAGAAALRIDPVPDRPLPAPPGAEIVCYPLAG